MAASGAGGVEAVYAEENVWLSQKMPMTMEDWERRLSGFLQLWDREILEDAGKDPRGMRV